MYILLEYYLWSDHWDVYSGKKFSVFLSFIKIQQSEILKEKIPRKSHLERTDGAPLSLTVGLHN